MSTAPPTTRLPLYTDPLHLHSTASFLPPASTIASDSSFWAAMSPQVSNAQSLSRKSTTPPTDEASTNNGGLCFIVGGTPAELKSKTNMTKVRKKAMDSYLTGGKKRSRNSTTPGRSNRTSPTGSDSGSGIGRDEPTTEVPTLPTPAAQPVGRRSNSDTAMVRRQIGSVLPPPPIVLPMRPNTVLPYDIHIPPVLKSLGKSLDPFRTMYETNHPLVSVEEMKHHCSRYFGTRGLGQHWIPTCLDHPHTFLSTLCLASTHHDIIRGKPSESLATAVLRQEIIHTVGANLCNSEESVADHNIVAVTQLIIGEVIGREEMSLTHHEAGVMKMIQQRGGLDQLGMGGHLASAISWVSLASAIFREAKPRPMYADYSASRSTKKYLPRVTIPESPIFRPHDTFITLQQTDQCGDQAMKVIHEIWAMIELFLHETKQRRRNSQTLLNMYKTICDFEPISEIGKTNVLTERDWRYEAIRIAAIIQATAIIQRVPLSEALTGPAPRVPPSRPSPLYTNSIASRSSDSVISPFDMRHDTPVTEYSTSPSYSAYSTSPAMGQNGFPFTTGPRQSFSSTYSFSNAQRPSLSSIHSSSSDTFYFPPPVAPASTGPTSRLRALKDALENSNLSDSWAEMGGVLLWIGLVVGAASRKSESKVLKRYFSATAMRAAIILCFDHPEPIHATMLRMTEVVEALGDGGSGKAGEVARTQKEQTGNKRRK